MNETTKYSLRLPIRQTLKGSVADSLREAFLEGAFAAGERVAEAQLAKQLEVSRVPVREALAILEQEGLVSRTSTGTMVNQLTREDALEICSLRFALESLSIRWAMRRVDRSWCAALVDNVERTRGANDAKLLAKLDLEFHEIMVRAANHQRLLTSWLALKSQIRLLMTQRNFADSRSLEGTIRTHEELIELLRLDDAVDAIARIMEMLDRQLQAQCKWFMQSFENASGQ